MSLSDLASLGSFVSGLAVLASLVFLFFQMRQMTEQVRQSERNQQALIRQGVRTRAVELNISRTEPSVAEAVAKGHAGAEDTTRTQYEQYSAYALSYLVHIEDAFFQHQEGLLIDSAFATVRGGLKNRLSDPGLRQYWEDTRNAYPGAFVKFVDELIAETPLMLHSDRFDHWKAGLAAMKAGVH
jgi:hypothetical protein